MQCVVLLEAIVTLLYHHVAPIVPWSVVVSNCPVLQGNAMCDNKHSSNGSQQQSEKEDIKGSDDSEEDDVEDSEAGKAPYLEYNSNTASTAFLNELAGGWTAYVVAVSSSD